MKEIEGYNFFTKLLHKSALSYSQARKTAFDIDCLASKTNEQNIEIYKPVFVTGLARSGSTLLLELLYSSGAFSSLTYRDMPFVMAPYIWEKYISKYWQRGSEKERAHGDGLKVDFDSPEAFEEVFWLTFSKSKYVNKNYLKSYTVNNKILDYYKRYIINILSRDGNERHRRYLAKNNNNVLRIGSIKSAFPNSIILVPFRNPISHAYSLLNQHKRFMKVHKRDRFAKNYMKWLGHFEFGENFKPFNFGKDLTPRNKEETFNINYWIKYWISVYEHLLYKHSRDVAFFSYNKLCEDPKSVFEVLKKVTGIDPTQHVSFEVMPPTRYLEVGIDNEVRRMAMSIYKKLEVINL